MDFIDADEIESDRKILLAALRDRDEMSREQFEELVNRAVAKIESRHGGNLSPEQVAAFVVDYTD